MKKLVFKYRLEIAGALTGAALGLLYWKFVGCESGTCAITSSPVNSSIYGAIMGALLAGLFKKETKDNSAQDKPNHEERRRTDQVG